MRHLFIIFLVATATVCHGQEQIQPAPMRQLRSTVSMPHRFFDAKNLELHGWNIAAETYDAVTTRRDLHGRPINELNPFGALFVNHGWGGQVIFSYGFGVGGPLLTSYLLHRFGHHKLERVVVAINAGGSTFAGTWNLKH
jgi:hypothetical protein